MEHMNQNFESEIKIQISAWEQSGKSKKQYCRDNNISFYRFYYWYRKFNKIDFCNKEDFVPLRILDKPAIKENKIEIHYPNGVKLLLTGENNLSYLRELIKLGN
jgi:hypothetical protein